MPLFYFHLRRQDDFDPDTEGTTFDNLAFAKEDAGNTLRELVAEELRAGRRSDLTAIEIANNGGDIVAIISIDDAVLRPLLGASSKYTGAEPADD